jgi:hypothetical protein
MRRALVAKIEWFDRSFGVLAYDMAALLATLDVFGEYVVSKRLLTALMIL